MDIEAVQSMEEIVTLPDLKLNPLLEGMPLLARGQRLSVQPVSEEHYNIVCKMGGVEN